MTAVSGAQNSVAMACQPCCKTPHGAPILSIPKFGGLFQGQMDQSVVWGVKKKAGVPSEYQRYLRRVTYGLAWVWYRGGEGFKEPWLLQGVVGWGPRSKDCQWESKLRMGKKAVIASVPIYFAISFAKSLSSSPTLCHQLCHCCPLASPLFPTSFTIACPTCQLIAPCSPAPQLGSKPQKVMGISGLPFSCLDLKLMNQDNRMQNIGTAWLF